MINLDLAVISDNEHSYLPELPNEKARIVRCILKEGIRLFNNKGGISIYCAFFAQIVADVKLN